MSFFLRSPKVVDYSSKAWHKSQAIPNVQFSIRRISLSQRLELATRMRELSMREEFLRAGDAPEQLESSICDLLTRKLLLEWGLTDVSGISIDKQPVTVDLLLERGPESLAQEILTAIQAEAGLSEQERKNS